jgi:chromosomal replication initiator protein
MVASQSRLQCGLVVDIHPTDYELRLGVLQHKAERMRERNPRVEIADGVLEFIARKISSNVRVLEGALTRLFALPIWSRRTSRWNWRRIAWPTSSSTPTAR